VPLRIMRFPQQLRDTYTPVLVTYFRSADGEAIFGKTE